MQVSPGCRETPGAAPWRSSAEGGFPQPRPSQQACGVSVSSHAVADTSTGEPKQHTGRAGHSGVLRRRPGGVNTPGPEPRTEGLQSVCYTDRHGEAGLRVCRGRAMARSRTRVSEVSSGSRYLSPRFLSRREADLARSKRSCGGRRSRRRCKILAFPLQYSGGGKADAALPLQVCSSV